MGVGQEGLSDVSSPWCSDMYLAYNDPQQQGGIKVLSYLLTN
jgi:hypothetical protein